MVVAAWRGGIRAGRGLAGRELLRGSYLCWIWKLHNWHVCLTAAVQCIVQLVQSGSHLVLVATKQFTTSTPALPARTTSTQQLHGKLCLGALCLHTHCLCHRVCSALAKGGGLFVQK